MKYRISIYPTSWPWIGHDTKSIFKRSKAGLNSDIFFLDWLPKQD